MWKRQISKLFPPDLLRTPTALSTSVSPRKLNLTILASSTWLQFGTLQWSGRLEYQKFYFL